MITSTLEALLRARDQPGYLSHADLEHAVELARAMARRDWAVRVLDAWADEKTAVWEVRRGCAGDGSPRAIVWVEREAEDADHAQDGYLEGEEGDERFHCDFDRPTPDAAREAAALAVWPELSAEKRAEIGGRP